MTMGCGAGCGGGIDIGPALAAGAAGGMRTLAVPLDCFARRGADMGGIETPFRIDADAPFAAAFANIRIVAGVAAAPGAVVPCPGTGA